MKKVRSPIRNFLVANIDVGARNQDVGARIFILYRSPTFEIGREHLKILTIECIQHPSTY